MQVFHQMNIHPFGFSFLSFNNNNKINKQTRGVETIHDLSYLNVWDSRLVLVPSASECRS